MPRRLRASFTGIAMHVVQRANNGNRCFFRYEDYQLFLRWLELCAAESDCEIHAYVLMSNHIHLLTTPRGQGNVSRMMKRLAQRYAQYINRTHGRTGTLWGGRFFSCLVQGSHYLISCHRYIEMNPVRAGIVAEPADYLWSSHRANAYDFAGSFLTPHPAYQELGTSPQKRLESYRALFHQPLAPQFGEQLRGATRGNFALGDQAFVERLARELNRRMTPP